MPSRPKEMCAPDQVKRTALGRYTKGTASPNPAGRPRGNSVTTFLREFNEQVPRLLPRAIEVLEENLEHPNAWVRRDAVALVVEASKLAAEAQQENPIKLQYLTEREQRTVQKILERARRRQARGLLPEPKAEAFDDTTLPVAPGAVIDVSATVTEGDALVIPVPGEPDGR